jgi:hypothetical protein
MPQGNYLNAFRAPDLAGIDQAAYSNSLLKNDVARLPQANRMQDQRIEMQDHELSAGQKENARGVLGRGFALIANSQRPREAARAFLASPDFLAAGKMLGIPVEQFSATDQDTDDVIRQGAGGWAQALEGTAAVPRLENPNIPSNVRSAEYYAGLSDTGPGVTRSIYNEANRAPTVREIAGVQTQVGPGGSTSPLGTLGGEVEARRQMAAAQASGSASGEVQGGTKPVRLQAAHRRLDRVKQASESLSTGGPIIGGLIGMTPGGQELDQANAQLLTELTALTRVPGVGAQSDLEQRLAQLQLPTAGMYPAVRANAIKELEAFLADLDVALSNVDGGAGAVEAVNDINALLDLYAPTPR